MPQFHFQRREISCKVVYYGPAYSGKTTNLEVVHRRAPADKKSELVSISTEADRTLFFDYMPLEVGRLGGFQMKFQLYTVPGQAYYNATRKLVLRGVDGVVFVADSQADRLQDNLESFANMEENLREHGIDPARIPLVIQWNKRDMPGAMDVEALNSLLNKYRSPAIPAVAVQDEGVFGTLKQIARQVFARISQDYCSRGGRPPRRVDEPRDAPAGGEREGASDEPEPVEPERPAVRRPEAESPPAVTESPATALPGPIYAPRPWALRDERPPAAEETTPRFRVVGSRRARWPRAVLLGVGLLLLAVTLLALRVGA